MPNEFVTDHSRLIDRYRQQADAAAAKAGAWSGHLATAEVELAKMKGRFVADPSDTNARALADAANRVRDFNTLTDAITDAGGPDEARARELKNPEIFAAFAKGFGERITALEKLVPPALKALAIRRGLLTEQGLAAGLIEADQFVGALRVHHTAIVTALATAVFGKNYCAKRGEGYPAESFNTLYARLTAALPQAPAIPAA